MRLDVYINIWGVSNVNVDFIWITNYKSINKRSKLVVDPAVTTIIGKNESGKSNLLNIIGSVSLITGISDKVYSEITRGIDSAEMKVEIECSFTKEEMEKLGIKDIYKTTFTISRSFSPYKVAVSGAISQYFTSEYYQNLIGELDSYLEENIKKVKDANTREALNKLLNYLKDAPDYVISNYANHITKIKQQFTSLFTTDKKILAICENLTSYFKDIYALFPIFYQYKETPLLNQYQITKEFFEKESAALKSLEKLMAASNCSMQDIKNACLINSSDGADIDAERKIKMGIQKYIDKDFNEFYNQGNKVELIIKLTPNKVRLYVNTGGPTITFSERSNGLRWYLNLYIDMLANNLLGRHVVYLIDEPGVYLHVDAQKNILELFDELSKHNQIIYTTHSPFMLNENRIDRIRAMKKGEEGFSNVVNSVMSSEIVNASNSETLSPLVSSLGMKLDQNLGMSKDKINVITEGYTDAIYLSAMAKVMGIEQFKFIPSIGASQVVHIANILWGWGFKYKVLFDWDRAGRAGRKALLKQYLFDDESQEAREFTSKHIVMISDVFDHAAGEMNLEIESLIDPEDYQVLGMDYSQNAISENSNLKKVSAQNFADKVLHGNITLSEQTNKNFDLLFKSLSEKG